MKLNFSKIRKLNILFTLVIYGLFYFFNFGLSVCPLTIKNCVDGMYKISLICPSYICLTPVEAIVQYLQFIILPLVIIYFIVSLGLNFIKGGKK
jgi:hypothetical protein